MRRASIALSVFACALALSGAGTAQPRRRSLHTRLDGDLLAELTGGGVPLPATPAELAHAAAAASGWRPDQPSRNNPSGSNGDPPETLHPREGYEAPTREMDRRTAPSHDTRLSYHEVFTPSISPFKRQQAYDMVDGNGQLTVRAPQPMPVPMGDDELPQWARAPRSRFVGEINVEVSPDAPTPIPSVGAEERVVSYTTSTGHAVIFLRDSAGNLFVQGTERETLQLTYVLEAPEDAFQASRVPHIPIAQAAAEIPEADRPQVPEFLRAAAPGVLARLDVARDGYLDDVLGALVGWFRGFRDEALPDAPSGDLYSELATSQVGACRHRAYAMTLTLHALGIPARYVGNEAHAWVEVYVSGLGWSRFDLGGWNVPLDTHAEDRPHHRTANADPFLNRRPPEYTSQPSATEDPTGGRGSPDAGYDPSRASQASSEGTAGNPNATGAAASGAGAGGTGGGVGSGPGAAAGGRSGAAGATAGMGATTNAAMSPRGVRTGNSAGAGAPERGSSEADTAAGDDLAPVVLTIATVQADEAAGFRTGTGYVRGSMVRVEGELRDERAAGVGGLAVELFLVRSRGAPLPVGTTASREDGHWEARVVLPAELEPGEYNLRAVTPGDTRHASARAE